MDSGSTRKFLSMDLTREQDILFEACSVDVQFKANAISSDSQTNIASTTPKQILHKMFGIKFAAGNFWLSL